MDKKIEERNLNANIWDMFWAICLQWRKVLVFALVFSIIAGILGSAYDKKIEQNDKERENVSFEDIELDIDEKENVDLYLSYMKLYNDQSLYNQKAPLMKMDANGFYLGTISYYVDNHFVVEYPAVEKANNIDAIIKAYQAKIQCDAVSKEIQEVMKLDVDAGCYAMQLVDLDNTYGNSSNLEMKQDIINISIYANDKETCEQLMQIVQTAIIKGKQEIQNCLGEHEIVLLDEQCSYVSSKNLLNYQKENLDMLYSYNKIINEVKAKLSSSAWGYIEAYQKENGNDQLVEQNANDTINTYENGIISFRYVALGFLGGMILIVCILVVTYLLNQKIRLEDDIELLFDTKLLGCVVNKVNERKKIFGCIDCFFEKMRHSKCNIFNQDEQINMIATEIMIFTKKHEIKRIFITGAVCGEYDHEIMQKVTEKLNRKGLETIMGNSVLYCAEALEKSAEIGFVVLVERAGVSSYSEVAREIETCKQHGIQILGIVVAH